MNVTQATAERADPVVNLSGVSKSWPARRSLFRRIISQERGVLSDVSLHVRRGTIAVLLGENGAGKTTLLKIVAGLARPDTGAVSLFGESDACAVDRLRAKRVSYSGGERGFYFRLTVRENLRFFATLDGFRGKRRCERVDRVCDIVDLRDDVDRRFSDLSSGLRQRVAIARALLGDPDLLLLDEPTRTLDPLHAEAVRTFVRETLVGVHGKTVILATNQLAEAERLGDTVFVLRDAKLHELAGGIDELRRTSPDELFHPYHPEVAP
jgi:ABC-2 type transport system ATP-binding protein